MSATTSEAASSHVVMLSQPQVVIDVIRKAVKAASGSNGNSLKPPSLLRSSARPPLSRRPLSSIVDESRYHK